ncbi:DMSO/selenate family reductase complex B subunit [Orbus wheelerorum]|uniref:DMSO/selenate family reductase complex B subunit n=1 Tax=Orbus wheelerorum TaxID=3074111 RepID=UPI00370D6786
MQYGFYINSAKCTGCKTCQVSCKDEKDTDIGTKFRRVYEYGGGSWQQTNGLWQNNTFAYYLSISCNHCQEPTCVHGCPTGAMHKRKEDGLVVVDQDVCVGCRYCEMRCPYGAPQFDHQKRVMSKCDGCYERVSQGLKPVCVDSCPQRALEFDDINVLREKYGNERDIAPLPNSSLTKPNIVINTHAHAKCSGDTIGRILNPEEI